MGVTPYAGSMLQHSALRVCFMKGSTAYQDSYDIIEVYRTLIAALDQYLKGGCFLSSGAWVRIPPGTLFVPEPRPTYSVVSGGEAKGLLLKTNCSRERV
jgi:hypothetical protein